MTATAPLTILKRVANYYDQTGWRELTPRQRRRAIHKANRYARRVGAA